MPHLVRSGDISGYHNFREGTSGQEPPPQQRAIGPSVNNAKVEKLLQSNDSITKLASVGHIGTYLAVLDLQASLTSELPESQVLD